ncbi:MAG: helix-turn-helix transcriptional regulator [Bauldia sp.]|nr:helix-turn-helix transcriptional regulator [Bauldia sp.]
MSALAALTRKIHAASLDRSLWWRITEDIASLTLCNRIWLFGGPAADFVPTAGHSPKIPIDQVIGFILGSLAPEGEASPDPAPLLEGALIADAEFHWIPFGRGATAQTLVPKGDGHRLFALALSRESREACDAMRREMGEAGHRYRAESLLADLSPHILASHEVARTLARNRIYLGGAEPKTGRQAVFLLGVNGKVVFANAAADELLQDADSGLCLGGGMLSPPAIWSPEAAAPAKVARRTEDAPAPAWRSVARSAGRLPLFSLVFALDRQHCFQSPATPRTIVIVCDPEMRAPQVTTLLRQTWPLTHAEAKVAAQIYLGRGIDDVAAKLDVTRETIRTHLKRTYAKTGTSNQAELVAFVAAIQSIYFPF